MAFQDDVMAAIKDHVGVAAADRLCGACTSLLSVDGAAISLVLDGENTGTLGASDAQARTYDELQFTLGEGPCLDSVATRTVVLVADVARLAEREPDRWPIYGPALLELGVRSVFALPILIAGEYVGALDLFRRRPGPLAAEHLAGAQVAADLAEMPLLDLLSESARAESTGDVPSEDLFAATRAEVNQATGMLVAQLGVDPAEALLRLRAHAFATGRSATDVARDILERRLRLEPE
ncbi:GAF and ANTAR domain-containing protein [Jatrophihabitans fulvus]